MSLVRGAARSVEHLVADGNRRRRGRAAARSDETKAGISDAAFFHAPAGTRRLFRRILRRRNLVVSTGGPRTGTRTLYGDHDRFESGSTSPPIRACTFTGDGCRRDEDGYYWITGRVDDVINVSGHRLGTANRERACGSIQRSLKRRWWVIPTTSRAKASTATSPRMPGKRQARA